MRLPRKKCESPAGPRTLDCRRYFDTAQVLTETAVCCAACCYSPWLSPGAPRRTARVLLPESTKSTRQPTCVRLLFPRPFLFNPQNIYKHITITQPQNTQDFHDATERPSPCDKPTPSHAFTPPAATISSTASNHSNPSPLRSDHHSVDLNFNFAPSNSLSSDSVVTIPPQDFPVFTTDSQSTWPPNSSPSLPASSAHQYQPLSSPNNQQRDFVLFDDLPPQRHNRSTLQSSQRRHSSQLNKVVTQQTHVAAPQHRVSRYIQASGLQSPSTVNAHRVSHNQINASALQSPARPPVPLFTQSTGSVPQQSGTMMNAADVDLDEVSVFGGGAASAFSPSIGHSNFDFMASAASSTSNLATISPHDLLIQDPFMSAPNSTALTALTTPSMPNDSPDFNDGFFTSPMFGNGDCDTSRDHWPSLFDNEPTFVEQQQQQPPPQSMDDVIQSVESAHTGTSPDVSDDARYRSTSSFATRRRSTQVSPGGISKTASGTSRKREKPLPPIVIEDKNDVVAMKRARNTLAARKSRQRKSDRFDELEARIVELEKERDHWRMLALQNGATN